jgi:hypothetical protein
MPAFQQSDCKGEFAIVIFDDTSAAYIQVRFEGDQVDTVGRAGSGRAWARLVDAGQHQLQQNV